MQTPQSGWWLPCKMIAKSVAIWVFIGVPVAATISATRVSVFVIDAIPAMAAAAAVLGAAFGVCLLLICPWSQSTIVERFKTRHSHLRWFGAIFGGLCGLLGFPPVYSHNSINAPFSWIITFAGAAIIAGVASGVICCAKLPAAPVSRSAIGRSIIVGTVALLAVAAVDYKLFWKATVDALPVPEVSRNAITSLAAGDAKGRVWSGCYDYEGKTSIGSGAQGTEGGLLIVQQNDGHLDISDLRNTHWIGGVDKNGHFRVGVESRFSDDILRTVWDGNFRSTFFTFTGRGTLMSSSKVINTTRITGTAQRISCNR